MEAEQNIRDLNNKEQFFRGIKDCIPTIFGYISIGIACGVLCRSCDLTLGEAVGMSTFIYGGSSQIIAAGMISSKASVLSIIITIFFVNLRHMFMSASMAPLSILASLIAAELLTNNNCISLKENLSEIIAAIPTIIVDIKKKNLLITVAVGIVSVALLRLVF